jgi:hypothetical protein
MSQSLRIEDQLQVKGGGMAQLSEIEAHWATGLVADRVKDYGLNSWQVAGRAELRRGLPVITARPGPTFGLDHRSS